MRGQVDRTGALVPGTSTLWQTGVGITGSQTLFDGFRTPNAIEQAEAGTLAAREQLRAVEQAVLLDVATTYLAVGAGQALVDVQRRNLAFLGEVLDNARTRFGAGVATPTDVSQAEARVSRGRSDLAAAETQLQIARDRFIRLVGAPPAARLAPVRAVDALIPRSQEAARDVAGRENPAVLAARATLEAAEAAVRVAQAQMLPNVTVNAALARDLNTQPDTIRQDQAAIVGRLSVPIFQGGAPEAQVRQAREFQRAARAQLDGARLQARSAGFAGYAAFLNAGATIRAATDEVRAAEAAVDGVRRQVESGVRTTVELLNAQQDAVLARSRLIVANTDRLVAGYTVLAATGRLEFERLGLRRPGVAETAVQPDIDVRFDAWRDMRQPTGPAGPPSRSQAP